MAGEILRQLYEHLACLAAVLRQPCVSNGFLTSHINTNDIENAHAENLVSTLRQPCDLVCRRAVLRCSILHLKASAKKQKFDVSDSTAAARLM